MGRQGDWGVTIDLLNQLAGSDSSLMGAAVYILFDPVLGSVDLSMDVRIRRTLAPQAPAPLASGMT